MNSIYDVWQAVLDQLSKKLTSTTIKAWFSDCEPIEIEDCRLVLSMGNSAGCEFRRDILLTRFGDMIRAALSDLFSTEFDIQILCGEELEEYQSKKTEDNALPETAGYTFENFIVGNSNKFAHAAAVAVADKPGQAYNPLFLYGNSGLGKTHLLRAIGEQIHKKNPAARIAYIKGDDFTNQMVKALKDGNVEEFRNKYRNVDLFLVDDIQFIAGKRATQEEFFHTFNNIYEAGHQIVITSDRPPLEMSLLDDRLRTRFEGGLMADIQPPDLETRMAIIRNKAAQLALILPDEAVEYIAEKITDNVRQLEGVINRITAYKEIMGEVVTMEVVVKAVQDVIRDGTYTPKPETIIQETARYFSLQESDLRGQSRTKNTTMARQISMYLIRSLVSMPLQEIGTHYEGRNHSTVLNSVRKVEELLKKDPSMGAMIRDITSNITSRPR